MSSHTGFRLFVGDRGALLSKLGVSLYEFLFQGAMFGDEEAVGFLREIRGMSRGGRFFYVLESLSTFQHLDVLENRTCSACVVEERGAIDGGETFLGLEEHTRLSPERLWLIAEDIERFFSWSRDNPARVAAEEDDTEECVRGYIQTAGQVASSIQGVFDDEDFGAATPFIFPMLHAIRAHCLDGAQRGNWGVFSVEHLGFASEIEARIAQFSPGLRKALKVGSALEVAS